MKKGIVIGIIFLFLAATATVAADNESVEVTSFPASQEEVTSEKPGLIAISASWIGSRASWLVTRDYLSFGRNLFKKVLALSLAVKIIILILFLILLVVLWNYTIRDSRANNLRRARRQHLRGEQAHRRGKEEKARSHYEKARKFREKAQEQW